MKHQISPCIIQKTSSSFSLRACAFFKFYAEVNLIRSYDERSTQLRVDLTEEPI
jgi:hypothetical protein